MGAQRKLMRAVLRPPPRRYTAELFEFIGPEKAVPAPDVNPNEQTMAWIMDSYSLHIRHSCTAAATGNPINIGASRRRREATAPCALLAPRKAVPNLPLQPDHT